MLPLLIISKKNNEIEDYLKQLISEQEISSSLIYRIDPPKDEIILSQVKELKRDLIIHENKTRLIVLSAFDRSGFEVQNSMLKILEENTEHNQFILVCANLEKILPTIQSRCKTIFLKKGPVDLVEDKWSILFDKIIGSKDLGFLNFPEFNIANKNEVIKIITQLILYFRKILHKTPGPIPVSILKKILYLSGLLENNNLNPQITLDTLLIFIWKSYRNK